MKNITLFLFAAVLTITASAQNTKILKAIHGFDKAEFIEYPTWFDGTPLKNMPDSTFDNILYHKYTEGRETIYMKRVVTDHYKPEWFGFLPKHLKAVQNKVRNVDAWHNFQKAFPVGAVTRVYLPAGQYELEGQMNIWRPFHVYGDGESPWSKFSTQLLFPAGSNGLVFQRPQDNSPYGNDRTHEFELSYVCVLGDKSKKGWYNGIVIQSRGTLRHVAVGRFAKDGVWVYANLFERNEASGLLFEKVHSFENGEDGINIQGADANAYTLIAPDVRDNGQFGIHDHSFLGGTIIQPMAHYNKKGDIYITDKANARVTIINAYSEGGSPNSNLSTSTTVIGGQWGSWYDIGELKNMRTGFDYDLHQLRQRVDELSGTKESVKAVNNLADTLKKYSGKVVTLFTMKEADNNGGKGWATGKFVGSEGDNVVFSGKTVKEGWVLEKVKFPLKNIKAIKPVH